MRSPSPNKSALRSLLALFAVAALGLGWFGLHASGGGEPLASVPIPINAPENLPDTPAEWRGRIDYRALDRQLSDLSRRPEMAGLAAAGVGDGELRFGRALGGDRQEGVGGKRGADSVDVGGRRNSKQKKTQSTKTE